MGCLGSVNPSINITFDTINTGVTTFASSVFLFGISDFIAEYDGTVAFPIKFNTLTTYITSTDIF